MFRSSALSSLVLAFCIHGSDSTRYFRSRSMLSVFSLVYSVLCVQHDCECDALQFGFKNSERVSFRFVHLSPVWFVFWKLLKFNTGSSFQTSTSRSFYLCRTLSSNASTLLIVYLFLGCLFPVLAVGCDQFLILPAFCSMSKRHH